MSAIAREKKKVFLAVGPATSALTNWTGVGESFLRPDPKWDAKAQIVGQIYTDESMTALNMVPTVYNFDSIGYRPDLVSAEEASMWSSLFDPKRAHHMYNDFMDELEYAAELGYDAICVNEHHSNGYGLMPSPNLIASSLARRTTDTALCVMGNSLALYNPPTRVAEEFAMIDCISGGRLIAGFPVGSPMDTCYAYGQNPSLLRERYLEAHDLVKRAWTEKDTFAFNGRFNHGLRLNNRSGFNRNHFGFWLGVTNRCHFHFRNRWGFDRGSCFNDRRFNHWGFGNWRFYSSGFFDSFYQYFLASSPEIRDKFAHTNMPAQKQLLRQGILNLVMHARGLPDTKLRALGESHSRQRLDIDPAAVTATDLNAHANHVSLHSGLPDQASGVYDVVLANILATPLKVLAPLLRSHVAAGGNLVLAGILERQAQELKDAYAPYCTLQVSDSEDGWILMTAQR